MGDVFESRVRDGGAFVQGQWARESNVYLTERHPIVRSLPVPAQVRTQP